MTFSNPLPPSSASDNLAGFVAPIPLPISLPIPAFEEFQSVMRLGQRYSSEHFMLHCAPRPAAPKLQTNRIGALLPKRWAKKAVRRNALRRQIYVLARQRLPLLAQAAGQPVDCVLRVRAAWSATVFISASSAAFKQSVEQELAALFTLAQGKMRPFAPSSSPKPSSAKPDNAVQA